LYLLAVYDDFMRLNTSDPKNVHKTMIRERTASDLLHETPEISAAHAWTLLIAASDRRRRVGQPEAGTGLCLTADGQVIETDAHDPGASLIYVGSGKWQPGSKLSPAAHELLDFYCPLLAASEAKPVVVGHLGQSVDAQIATESGDAFFVTGDANLLHLHRMRALCDAIVVGVNTVVADDPRLTTRLASGPNPVRVIIDPQHRVPQDRQVFNDGEARTLVACAESNSIDIDDDHTIALPVDDDGLSLTALVGELQQRGLHAVFIEGGGVTVTQWMNAGLLDRLHIATAPVLIGAGRAALQLPPAMSMDAALRPPYRLYRMGEDVLWDFDLRAATSADQSDYGAPTELQRLF